MDPPHCNTQAILSHTQQNGLKKHDEDVIVLCILLTRQYKMSRRVLITPATMPAKAWHISGLYMIRVLTVHGCMGLGLKSWLTHSMICRLCQQLRHFGDRWTLWFAESSCLAPMLRAMLNTSQIEPVRSSRISDQRCQTGHNKSDVPCYLPRWIKDYQTAEAVAPPSVRQQALNIGVGMGDEWVSIFLNDLWISCHFDMKLFVHLFQHG